MSDLENLLAPGWTAQITSWLQEDAPSFDYGGFVVGAGPSTARLLLKSPGTLAGVPFFTEVFRQLSCAVDWLFPEGASIAIPAGERAIAVAVVTGPARCILQGERVALNILARCSGIATRSRDLRLALEQAGYRGIVAGTRKTTPGFRLCEKYAMLVGGADTHRMDLSAMVMLKDNHVWLRGSIADAIRAARSVAGFSIKIEVEVQDELQADEAIGAGADVVMLDNFSGDGVRLAAGSLKAKWAGKRHFLVEVSGGVTLDNAAAYVCNDVDIISTSSIHQGVPHVDFSLKIDH
ncbi:Nicotinate-nucleotide pyrophosphorylase [Escovopsis weberi]|uniref:Nicotinate-nucleotide pyrophosphorylase [carboxylating] n=1 Tax=Escovopsis weberi TaxID=150374 RepID=A0A0M8N522_ESCWE|nr:Nicotinate-nucleotide pyrophosphorylase [Escovopsis weberi]